MKKVFTAEYLSKRKKRQILKGKKQRNKPSNDIIALPGQTRPIDWYAFFFSCNLVISLCFAGIPHSHI